MALVTIKEAAQRLNLSEDSIRRRIRSGELPSKQTPTRQGFIWMVEIPDVPTDAEAPPMQHLPATGVHSSQASENLGQQLADARSLIDQLKGEVTQLTSVLQAIEAHRDSLATQAEAQRRQIEAMQQQQEQQTQADEKAQSELRQLLLQAQLQVQALIPKLSAPEEAQEQRRRWWWPFGR
jgi:excisionase family DNA binding protein